MSRDAPDDEHGRASRADVPGPARRTVPAGRTAADPQPPEVRPRRTVPDGRSPQRTAPDGTPRRAAPDGTTRRSGPDGAARRTGPDSTARRTGPDGAARRSTPGGATSDRAPDGTTRRTGRTTSPGGRPPGPPAGRPVAQQGSLRLTPRGRVVLLGLAAAAIGLVVLLGTLVVRLLGGGAASGTEQAAEHGAADTPACVADATMSQNCWPAITDSDDARLVSSPWITGKLLAGDVSTVLDHVAERFDATVEPVDVDSSWGWAYRSVRGEDDDEGGLSNHASGTSIDLNATEHPLGSTGTFTDAQVEAIRAIVAEVSPVVAWGGDFDGRADEMHFEIVGDETAVAEVAARLRAASTG
jgi:hypothetical protein